MLDEVRERNPYPGYNHRPCLDAAHAIYALLERERPNQVLEMKRTGLLGMPFDRDRPRARLEVLRVLHRIRFAGAELVIIVVRAYVLVTVGLFLSAELARGDIGELSPARVRNNGSETRFGERQASRDTACLDEVPTSQVIRFTRNF